MKIQYRPVCLVLLLTALLFPVSGYAGWTDVIRNYSREDYHAGSQNWQTIRQNDHWMYFANKSGVLEYNGNEWKLYPLNNKTDVRAIQHAENRIYAGGLNEFGYLEPQKNGELSYICMSDSLLSEQRDFGNIWYIYEYRHSLSFIADNEIINYTDTTVSLIKTPGKVTFSNIIDDVLHIATDSGIYALIGNQFYKIPHSEEFAGEKIRGVYPFNHKILVATSSAGLYLLDKNGVSRFQTEVDSFIRKYELFSIAVNDEYIAIGTVLKGLALIDHSGKVLKYVNESNGLQNNTVLNILFDNNANVWLGLDNGVSYVMLDSPISNLYSKPNFYGAGYQAVLQNNILYLATNRGLYCSPYPIPVSEEATRLYLIDGSQGQIWDLNLIGDDLFCCSDKGLFIAKDKALQLIDRKTGVWNVSQIKDDPNKIWVSTYDGFYVFEKHNNQWKKVDYVQGYPGSAVNYAEESPRVLWIHTGKEEIVRININDSYNKITDYKYFKTNVTPPDNQHLPAEVSKNAVPENTYIFRLNEKLLFCSLSGIYSFNDADQSFSLNTDYTVKGQGFNAIWEKDDVRWYLGPVYVRKETKDSSVYYAHNLPLIEDFQRLAFLNENEVIICNENGFALWKSDYNHRYRMHETVSINRVSISKNGDSLIYVPNFMGTKYVPKISYINNTIRFQYGLMSFAPNSRAVYRYKLDNENWSEKTGATVKEYSKLTVGEHVFVVEAVLETGNSIFDEFHFIILPPWYRSVWAYIVYFLLLAAFLIGLWRWDNNRIKSNIKKETAQKEQEIADLKNERLEQEIKHKSQELANTAISLANKNEILMKIKTDLQKISAELNAIDNATHLRRNIIRLNNTIDENISRDDNLKKFEENFDLVHNNFTQKISDKYPSLSLNERKMCAFIKMQLSSKEIAPLLNISVRGAETLRYRLRKKFGLNRKDSLTSFLNQI